GSSARRRWPSRAAAGTRTAPGSGVSLLEFPDREARLDLFEDLFIRLAEIGGLGRSRLGLTFDVPHDVEQDLDRAEIGGGRTVDELSDDGLAFADLATPTVLGDDDGLVQRLAQQRRKVLGAGGPASRIAGLALSASGLCTQNPPRSPARRNTRDRPRPADQRFLAL